MKKRQAGFRWGWFSFALAVGAGCFCWGYMTGTHTMRATEVAYIAAMPKVYFAGLQPDPSAKWSELGRWVGFGFRDDWHKGSVRGFTGGVSLFTEPCPLGGFGGSVSDAGRCDTQDYRHRIMWICLEEQDCIYEVMRTVAKKCDR